jgi:hypothetical protein
MSDRLPRTEPELGDWVTTPIGTGMVVGWHRSATWLDERLERRNYVFVRLDGGGTRLFPVGIVRVEAKA